MTGPTEPGAVPVGDADIPRLPLDGRDVALPNQRLQECPRIRGFSLHGVSQVTRAWNGALREPGPANECKDLLLPFRKVPRWGYHGYAV